MDFIIVLVCSLGFCLLFKNAIRKVPGVFYALAVVLSLMYATTSYVIYPFWLQQILFATMQKGTLATALFVIVMYIGVFKNIDFVRHRLMPTRAALSIMGCLLILGHVVKYLIAYVPRFAAIDGIIQGGLAVAVTCFALMLVLGVTSFNVVKHAMSTASWAKLQRWAYLFYGLVYLHIVLLLTPSALALSHTDSAAELSLAVYTIVFGFYFVLRVTKAVRERRAVGGEAEHLGST